MPTIRLTDRTIAGLKPKRTQVDYFDRSFPGFGVRVSPAGTKTFQVLYRTTGGTLRRLSLGTYPDDLSLADARTAARDELKKASVGRDPNAERKAAKAQTIDKLCTDYIERHAKKRKRTWRDDQSKINAEILPAWQGRSVASITRRDCRALVQAVADRRKSGKGIYANRVAALLSRLFRFAVDEEIIEANIAFQLPKPGVEASARPEPEQEDKPYDPKEIRRIWAQTADLAPAPRALYRLGLVTGQRPGEISDMTRDEIDGTWWTIPAARAKNNRTHRVFLTPLALEVLKDVPAIEDEPLVFRGYRGKRQIAELNAQVFKGIRPRQKPRHAMRDTVATGLAEAGVHPDDISRVLNHAVGQRVTAVYNAYAYDKEKRLALLTWERRLRAILGRRSASRSTSQNPDRVGRLRVRVDSRHAHPVIS